MLGFITQGWRVTHRGPNWIGIHHPKMGGYPSGPTLDWDSSPQDGRVTHRGPSLVGIHHPGLVGIAHPQIWLGLFGWGTALEPSMWCHPFAHLAHEPTWGGVRLARSGVHSESMHLDVGCLEGRSVEPSGTLGRRESGASSGLVVRITHGWRVGRQPVSSHGRFSRSRSSSRSVPRHDLDSSLVHRRHHRRAVSLSLHEHLRISQR